MIDKLYVSVMISLFSLTMWSIVIICHDCVDLIK